MNELALFAGAGGGILGGHLLGWRCVCAVELEDYPRRVLLARQRDGMLPRFPIWDDVTTFDGRPWRGRVDVISGGFPCQDISAAGRGAGITGTRSGLWSHMARIIGEVRPRYCFVENSPLLVSRGLDVVLSDLAALGYDARWGIVGAHHAGAPHKRDRIWIRGELAYPVRDGQQPDQGWKSVPDGNRDSAPHAGGWAQLKQGAHCAGDVADADGCLCDGRTDQPERGPQGRTATVGCGEAMADTHGGGPRDEQSERYDWWQSEPYLGGILDGLALALDIHGAAAAGDVGRVAMGVPNRAGRLKAIGNGQVPAVAALAWRILSNDNQ